MNKALKIVIIFFVGGLLTMSAIAFIAPFWMNDYLKSALIEEFNVQTEQEYTLDFSTFEIGIFRRSISIDSISVLPDSAAPHIREIKASSISLIGIKWRTLFNKSFPDFNTIMITEPEVELFTRNFSASDFSNSNNNQNAEIANNLAKFDLIIQNGSGKLLEPDQREVLVINDISLEAKDVDVNALLDGSELFFLEDLTITGSGLKWSLEDKLYQFTINNFSFDKNNERISLENLAMTPVVPKYEFSKIRAYQLDRIDLRIPRVELSGFKLDSLASEHLDVDSLKIYDAWMEVFRNKQIDRAPGISTKPLLNEVAHSFDFSFGLDEVLISDATIIYEEHKPPSDTSGSISFNEIDATLTKFRTAEHPRFFKDTLKLHVETLFMDVTPLTVDVNYPIFDEQDTHTVKVRLESFDPKAAGNMLENVGFVRIEDGLIKSLDAEFELNSEKASGKLEVLYQNLKVSFLKKNNPDRENFFQRTGDLLANTFVIKSNNDNATPRVGEIDFEREDGKSIFAYWWKSLLSGIKDTIK